METASFIAVSHRSALNRQMNVVSNNLANMNTTAYRGERTIFQEYLQETQDGQGGHLSFVQDTTTFRRDQQGEMQHTGNPLDVALNGEGFFTVQTEEGPRYTRAGDFHLNPDGEIVTNNAQPVLDTNGNPIAIPEDAESIDITAEGSVRADGEELAQLDVVSFEEPEALTRHAAGLYEAGEEQQPQPIDENTTVEQGVLEGSNVKGIKEMTHMMDIMKSQQNAAQLAQQDHEMALRAIRTLVQGQG
ncbi:flagellar basal-body rod protein FlgF [Limimonas halophila]|uniref:Flagellar basal-body rod protein FlgF n=1 Tax=Limimonas halophila TaxID=1082479 RepID=A0A1G7Q7E7_9PROT|nr:flagellar basal-body rod protein FlgF [Limimonas halophila]SDF93849.1 flagellar basal-body rod protein FlgF [Limimonas halophila]